MESTDLAGEMVSEPNNILSSLEEMLLVKATEIGKVAQLGKALLEQQQELETKIKNFDFSRHRQNSEKASMRSTSSDSTSQSAQLQAIKSEIDGWDKQNNELCSIPSLPTLPSTSSLPVDPISTSVSRRNKNNEEPRADSMKWVEDISNSLLQELRRVQGLLKEKELLLAEMRDKKDETEQRLEAEERSRKNVESSIDKYKEDNWNLEVSTEEYKADLLKTQSIASKAEAERLRLSKELTATKELLDIERDETEKLKSDMDTSKVKFETDLANMRRNYAGLQRDRSDLMGTLDGLRLELATKSRGMKRSISESPSNSPIHEERPDSDVEGEEEMFGREKHSRRKTGDGLIPTSNSDLFDELDEEPSFISESNSSPAVRQGSLPNDVEGLKNSLAHAQRTISTLRISLAKLKGGSHSRRSSVDFGEQQQQWEEGSDASSNYGTPIRTTAPRSVRGSVRGARGSARRGNQRKSVGVPSRLGMEDASSLYEEEMDESFVEKGGIFDHDFIAHEEEMSEGGLDSPSSSRRSSHQMSVDLDPDYVNQLENNRSILSEGSMTDSPFAHQRSTSGHKRRSSNGSFIRNNRPLSGIFNGMEGRRDFSSNTVIEDDVVPAVMMVDCMTMTEPVVELPAPIPIPVYLPPPPKETTSIGIQCTPVPIPELVKMDFSSQTEAEIKIITMEKSISTDPIPIPDSPFLIEMATSTDPIPVGIEMGTSMDRIVFSEKAIATDLPTQLHQEIQTDTVMAEIPPIPIAVSNLSHQFSFSSVKTTQPLPRSPEPESDGSRKIGSESGASEFQDAVEIIPTRDFFKVKTSPTRTRKVGIYEDSETETEDETMEVVEERDPDRTIGAISVEAGVQTDTVPAPIINKKKSIPLIRNRAINQARESINTFGRPEDDLETSAAVAAAYTATGKSTDAGRSLSSRDGSYTRDSLMSSFTQLTEDNSRPTTANKGKGPESELMGPPLSRNPSKAKLGPRKSGGSTSATSTRSSLGPDRPTTRPPADLLYRAQSPTFDSDYERSHLFVPGTATVTRGSSSSMPPPQSTTPRLMSSKTNLRGQKSMNLENTTKRVYNDSSVISLSSTSMNSRRHSIESTRTSEGGRFMNNDTEMGEGTDSNVIQAITQTMIGEFLYKYTRRTIGKGISDKRHKRFFWVHPYTKTLYWSAADPGAQGTNQSSAKSVFITGVRQVIDSNPFPAGLHSSSIIITTPTREVTFTAVTKERHDMWFNAIKYLLARPDISPKKSRPTMDTSPSKTTIYSNLSIDQSQTPSTTLRQKVSKIYSTHSISESRLKSNSSFISPNQSSEFGGMGLESTPRSLRGYKKNGGDRHSDQQEDLFEGLENVRACCGGRHDVGSLSRPSHHHSHSQSEAEYSENDFAPRFRSKSSTGTNVSYSNSSNNRKSQLPVPGLKYGKVAEKILPFASAPNGRGMI